MYENTKVLYRKKKDISEYESVEFKNIKRNRIYSL